jgi:tetratricopeptide (TPR) repeat protein
MDHSPNRVATLLIVGLFSAHFAIQSVAAQSAPELASAAARSMQQGDYDSAERYYKELLRLAPGVAEVYSNLGLAYYSQKKVHLAEEVFEKALKLAPELFVPNFVLGQIRIKQGRSRDALSLLETALKIQPEDRNARRLLAAALVGFKRYDEAIEQYEKMLEQSSRDVDALYGLGRIYVELGQASITKLANFKDSGFVPLASAEHFALEPEWRSYALERYRQAIASCPNVPGMRIALGNLELAGKDWDAARRTFKEEVVIDPFSYEAWFGLAVVKFHEGDIDAALECLNEAVRVRPEFFDPLPEFSVDSAPELLETSRAMLERRAGSGDFAAVFMLSQVLTALGRQDAAEPFRSRAERDRDRRIEEYRSRSAKSSEDSGTLDRRRTQALEYLREKRYEDGLRILLPLAESSATDSAVRRAVTRALFQLQHFEDLVKLLKGTNSTDPEMLYFLATSYKKLALRTLERMLELDPQSARAHQLLGDSFYVQQRFKEAAGEYELALRAKPDDSELYFILGDTYFKQRQFDAAARALARATELDPYNAEASLMGGRALVLLNRPEEAIPFLRRALELEPRSAEAHVVMGKAYSLMGQIGAAARHLELGASSDTDGSVHYQLFKLYTELGQDKKAKDALLTYKKLRGHQ